MTSGAKAGTIPAAMAAKVLARAGAPAKPASGLNGNPEKPRPCATTCAGARPASSQKGRTQGRLAQKGHATDQAARARFGARRWFKTALRLPMSCC